MQYYYSFIKQLLKYAGFKKKKEKKRKMLLYCDL